jgi:DNA-binding NtrC family response regulator
VPERAGTGGDRSLPSMLIVDDEPDMLDFLERTFRRSFKITRAGDPEVAIAYLRNRHFDVLITDQKMPRSTGVELLEQIVDSHPDLIKVLLSGYADAADVQKALEACGASAYLVKPVDAERLTSVIDELMANR